MSKLGGSPASLDTGILRMFVGLISLNGRRRSPVGYTNAFRLFPRFAVRFALPLERDIEVHNK
jgi:hypothetical protein